MMNLRIKTALLLSVATLAVAMTPATSHAAQDASMDTCISTFVEERLPKNQPIRIVKRRQSTTPLFGSGNSRMIEVTAKGAQTDKDYGAATCVLNGRGALVAMYAKGEQPRLAKADSRSESHGG